MVVCGSDGGVGGGSGGVWWSLNNLILERIRVTLPEKETGLFIVFPCCLMNLFSPDRNRENRPTGISVLSDT